MYFSDLPSVPFPQPRAKVRAKQLTKTSASEGLKLFCVQTPQHFPKQESSVWRRFETRSEKPTCWISESMWRERGLLGSSQCVEAHLSALEPRWCYGLPPHGRKVVWWRGLSVEKFTNCIHKNSWCHKNLFTNNPADVVSFISRETLTRRAEFQGKVQWSIMTSLSHNVTITGASRQM